MKKTFALKYRSYVDFICMDDKHTCKVGEPGFPVAAVERGKEVIISINMSSKVADHEDRYMLASKKIVSSGLLHCNTSRSCVKS